MARGAGEGGRGDYSREAIILNISSQGGDYSKGGYYSRKYDIQTPGNFSIHLYRPNRS